MKIRVDSDEYRCWHEAGHAAVCLFLGGDVKCIEFLDGKSGGFMRTRTFHDPIFEKDVACAGFAAEYYLYRFGHAEQAPDDMRNISQVFFHNATHDREDFYGRVRGEEFTKSEDEVFMHHAIGEHGNGGVLSILHEKFPAMKELVRELCESRRLEGARIKELLRIDDRRPDSN